MDEYADVDVLSGGMVSPDGRMLAYVSNAGGRPQPWLLPLSGAQPSGKQAAELTVPGMVSWCTWRPDGSRLVIQTDLTGAEDFRLAELDPATGALDWIGAQEGVRYELSTPYDRGTEPYSPDGRLLAYASNARDVEVFDVYVRDLAAGTDRMVLRGDDRYFPVSFSPDAGQLLVVRLHQNTEYDLWLVDLGTGDVRELTPHNGPAKFLPVGWAADGRTLYLTGTAGRDRLGLAALALESNELAWLETPEHDVEGGAVSPDGRLIAWGVNEDGYTRLHWRNLVTGEYGAPTNLPAGLAIVDFGLAGFAIRFTADGRYLLVQLGRPNAASELYLVEVPGGTAHQLTRCGERLPADLVDATVVRYPSTDGLTIAALLYRPTGADADHPAPVVLHIHGGPEVQAFPEYDPLIQGLLANGIGVLAPNFRGSAGYGLRFQRSIYRDWGGGDLADFAASIRYVRELDWVAGDRLGVYGASYGGFASLCCLTRLPELWRVGVSVCGTSDLIGDARTVPPTWRRRVRDWIGDPDDPADAASMVARSPLHHAQHLRAPLLLVHGENDTRVLPEESNKMYRKLAELGLPVKLISLPGVGHATGDRNESESTGAAILNWLTTHLR